MGPRGAWHRADRDQDLQRRPRPTTSVVRLTTIFEAGLPGEAPARWVRTDHLRLVNPDELAAYAESAGLQVETLAGDYDLGGLAPGAERVVLVARRR